MYQDGVQERLLRLRECREAFTVVFTGKNSSRVNGLYRPSDREILIHNRNITDGEGNVNENRLMYTAIHELAHHVLATEFGEHGRRCHTQLFWSCFHDLLDKAESMGIYRLELDSETLALAERAREISRRIAELQRELGAVLERTDAACRRQGIRTEDVFQRKIQLTVPTWRKAMAAAGLEICGEDGIGADQQAAMLGARSPEARAAMLEGSRAGKTVEQMKCPAIPSAAGIDDRRERLGRERERLEKTILTLERRLARVNIELIHLEEPARGPPGSREKEAS